MKLLDLLQFAEGTRGLSHNTPLFATTPDNPTKMAIASLKITGLSSDDPPEIHAILVPPEGTSGTEALSTIPASDGNPASSEEPTPTALVEEVESRVGEIHEVEDLPRRLAVAAGIPSELYQQFLIDEDIGNKPTIGEVISVLEARNSELDDELSQRLGAILPRVRLDTMDATIKQLVDELEYRKEELLASTEQLARLAQLLASGTMPKQGEISLQPDNTPDHPETTPPASGPEAPKPASGKKAKPTT